MKSLNAGAGIFAGVTVSPRMENNLAVFVHLSISWFGAGFRTFLFLWRFLPGGEKGQEQSGCFPGLVRAVRRGEMEGIYISAPLHEAMVV